MTPIDVASGYPHGRGVGGRDVDPVCAAILRHLPPRGHVLDLGSGSGRRISILAAHRPDLTFEPSDPDPASRARIDRRCAGLRNVIRAADLDPARSGWGGPAGPVEAVIATGVLSRMSESGLSVLLDEGVRALAPGGILAFLEPRADPAAAMGTGALRPEDPDTAGDPPGGDIVETVLGVLGLAVDRLDLSGGGWAILGRRAPRGAERLSRGDRADPT